MAATFNGRPGPLPTADRAESMSRLRLLIADSGTAPPENRPSAAAPLIEAPAPLRPLLRAGSIQRGSVVAIHENVPRSVNAGPGYLALALAAAATGGGAWCGVIGFPTFGVAAAAGLGADLSRFLMLDDPGDRWAEAVTIMAEACDLVLWRAPRHVPAAADRRIRARLHPAVRQRGSVLVVLVDDRGSWQGADLHLSSSDPRWAGIGQGFGHLTGRLVTVTAVGRAALGPEPSTRLWLPAGDGTVQVAGASEQPRRRDRQKRQLRPA